MQQEVIEPNKPPTEPTTTPPPITVQDLDNLVLQKIVIENYKSIQKVEIDIVGIADKKISTYALLGENGVGKSNILDAIRLMDFAPNNLLQDIKRPRAFNDINKDFNIQHHYNSDIIFKIKFNTTNPDNPQRYIFKKGKEYLATPLDANDDRWLKKMEVFYWENSDAYKLLDNIDIAQIQNNVPYNSILKICDTDPTLLSKYATGDTAARKGYLDKCNSALQTYLAKINSFIEGFADKETKCSIEIGNSLNNISFIIEDTKLNKHLYSSEKSSGFKRMLSFLFSIYDKNKDKGKIIIIDQTESDLHAYAQKNLLEELIDMTEGDNNKDNNNIIFFSSHSEYMIDIDCWKRNLCVDRKDKKGTVVLPIQATTNNIKLWTYFGIVYHIFHTGAHGYIANLYEYCKNKETFKNKYTDKCSEYKNRINKKDGSLPEFLRNTFHHPKSYEDWQDVVKKKENKGLPSNEHKNIDEILKSTIEKLENIFSSPEDASPATGASSVLPDRMGSHSTTKLPMPSV